VTEPRAAPAGDTLRFSHDLGFELSVELDRATALAFVRDVGKVLGRADFLKSVRVESGPPVVISAELPVQAASFGGSLPFVSEVVETDLGARLVPAPAAVGAVGWADVGGEARVFGSGAAPSRLEYEFAVTVTLLTPAAERWGGRALLKMIEIAGANVLRRVVANLPRAVEAAAGAEVAARAATEDASDTTPAGADA